MFELLCINCVLLILILLKLILISRKTPYKYLSPREQEKHFRKFVEKKFLPLISVKIKPGKLYRISIDFMLDSKSGIYDTFDYYLDRIDTKTGEKIDATKEKE